MRTPSAGPSPSNSPVRYTPPLTPKRQTFSDTLMEENIDVAEAIITRWDPKVSEVNSLFTGSRYEAKQFLNCIKNLQLAMHHFVNHQQFYSDKLARAQGFMQIAMKRLQKEFYDILSINKQYLDHESVSNHFSPRSSNVSSEIDSSSSSSDDEFTFSTVSSPSEDPGSSLAMADLKAIADCMISSGYGKECVNIYKVVRKSTVDEALYRLGMDWAVLGAQEVQKMKWEVLEGKIKNWLRAVKVSVKRIFYGERILCDHVFSSSSPVQQACFQEITRDGALALLGFPGTVAKTKKFLSPEKMFRILDMYEVVSDLLPEIEMIFSFESMVDVRSQAMKSLDRLGEAAGSMLTAFETAIEKDASKMAVPGGGVHPLTRYVMNYITFLSDYSDNLGDIVAEWAPPKAGLSHLPEDELSTSALTSRLAWVILILLCKLDGKAKRYKDVALSYLFMVNNLHYILVKVRNSKLRYLLGDAWISDHDVKLKDFIGNYEKMGWTRVINVLPVDPTVGIAPKETFRRFNLAFEEAYQKQKTWVVSDPKIRGEIQESLVRKICRGYKTLYERYGLELRREEFRESIVRFTPEDLENYLSDLFRESVGSGSVCVSSFSR